ncbi:Ribokinase-like protein [Neolentinus lepideus HHB14362 ss-1]|uniref:ATP-dependent (S)-NAD(P)H-hydrate dehydratase n=1 Tax=Neolentinus lepideus HHB14362 ss-1 TaxID=1314782 RepID=A0A165PX91_9AGAM|nr:Ribokinase-like protein [Neolentinus lepideus HHB14362 ss-1]
MPVPKHVFEQIKRLIPPLDGSLHKGQSGRIGVLGGAQDYTGAPFFAALSAFRVGCDLSHVICAPSAAPAIKSYAPDLIVHPILAPPDSDSVKAELTSLLSRLHALIIGPGLGREAYMQDYARMALRIAKEQGMFLVLDADALWMVQQDVDLIRGYRRAVITPNVMEFKRLSEAVHIDPKSDPTRLASLLSQKLGGVTVIQKGATDIIATNTTGASPSDRAQSHVDEGEKEKEEIMHVDTQGGYKRCGGQGDVLSGSVGAFLAWGKCFEEGSYGDKSIPPTALPALAATAGALLTRTASRRAFEKTGRAMLTEDMLPEIGKAFEELFGHEAAHGPKHPHGTGLLGFGMGVGGGGKGAL